MAFSPCNVTGVSAGLAVLAATLPRAGEAGPTITTGNRLATKKNKTSALIQRFGCNCLVMILMIPSRLCRPLFRNEQLESRIELAVIRIPHAGNQRHIPLLDSTNENQGKN